MSHSGWIVITTINPPTRAIEAVAECCRRGWSAVVVGDTKTPADWACDGITFLSVDRQRELFGDLAELVPYRHYCRKNLGYLYAISRGADIILETDDDNIPYDTFGKTVERRVEGRRVAGPGWVNIYRHFNAGLQIWPRGLPLDAIDAAGAAAPLREPVDCIIQQYLADNDPDVDAICRLTTKTPVFFDRVAPPAVLARGTWCPFNSQNTIFFPEAFPLLYLPCHVSFRMTDIWRSFVAQAAMHHHGHLLSFHPPTVEQLRNEHDLMKDFADEVDGYLGNRRIMQVLLDALHDRKPESMRDTAICLWHALSDAGVVPHRELPIMEAWFRQLGASMGQPE